MSEGAPHSRDFSLTNRTQHSEGSVMEAELAKVSDELDRLIERRSSEAREPDPIELEPSYAESVRRYNSAKDAARRAEWTEFHEAQAARHRRTLRDLIARHEAQARNLAEGGP